MRKGRFMLDLSSIQDDYLKEYLSLEHLRAFIYKSKLDKGKTKGINEENFYGVTCAQDVLALFKREEGKDNIPSCYLLHPITKALNKVEYSHLISYLEYLVYTQIDTTSFRYNPDAMAAYENFCENGSIKFDNDEFYFRRDEIENMIGAKIPHIEKLSDVENVKLTSLQDETADLDKSSDRTLFEYDADLPDGMNEEKLAYFIELIIDPMLLDNGKMPSYSKLYSSLDIRHRGKKKLPSKNTIKKYLNQ